MADSLDRWLDVAMSEYASRPAPLGFEARTIARLREEKPRQVWAWAAACATAAAIVMVAVLGLRVTRVADMPVPIITEHLPVPAIGKTNPVVPQLRIVAAKAKIDSTRGVPIVAAPITRQEEAILRVVRNARAKQLASLAAKPKEFRGESTPLEIQDLNIPTMFGEQK
jgi:hypothetical protein